MKRVFFKRYLSPLFVLLVQLGYAVENAEQLVEPVAYFDDKAWEEDGSSMPLAFEDLCFDVEQGNEEADLAAFANLDTEEDLRFDSDEDLYGDEFDLDLQESRPQLTRRIEALAGVSISEVSTPQSLVVQAGVFIAESKSLTLNAQPGVLIAEVKPLLSPSEVLAVQGTVELAPALIPPAQLMAAVPANGAGQVGNGMPLASYASSSPAVATHVSQNEAKTFSRASNSHLVAGTVESIATIAVTLEPAPLLLVGTAEASVADMSIVIQIGDAFVALADEPLPPLVSLLGQADVSLAPQEECTCPPLVTALIAEATPAATTLLPSGCIDNPVACADAPIPFASQEVETTRALPTALCGAQVAVVPVAEYCVVIATTPATSDDRARVSPQFPFAVATQVHAAFRPTRLELAPPLAMLAAIEAGGTESTSLPVAVSYRNVPSRAGTEAPVLLLGALGGKQADTLLSVVPRHIDEKINERLIVADAELVIPPSELESLRPSLIHPLPTTPITPEIHDGNLEIVPTPDFSNSVNDVVVPPEALVPRPLTPAPLTLPQEIVKQPIEQLPGEQSVTSPSMAPVPIVPGPTAPPTESPIIPPTTPVAPLPPSTVPSTEPIPLPDPIPMPTVTGQGFLINFNNVSIIEYIRFISKITGRNFIFSETDLNFGVTIVSQEPASVDDIMTALLQELRIHGLSLMEQGNNIIIHKNPAVKSPAQVVLEGTTAAASKENDLITSVFRLNTMPADQLAQLLAPLLSTDAIVEATKDSGHLIVTDLRSNIDKVADLVRNLDSPMGGLEVGQYVVAGASVDGLINIVQKVLAPIIQNKPFTLVAHTPSNSIYIISSSYLVHYAIMMMQHIDNNMATTGVLTAQQMLASAQVQGGPQGMVGLGGELSGQTSIFSGQSPFEAETASALGLPPEAIVPGAVVPEWDAPSLVGSYPKWNPELPAGHIENTQFYIHKLQFRKGDQIAGALRRIAESLQLSASSNADLLMTIDSIQWLEAPNSLVMTGTPIALEKVRELIAEVDVPLRQVFVEMLILDTNIEDSLTYGVDVGTRFGGPTSAGSQAFLDSPSILPGALNTAILPTSLGGTGPLTLNPALLSTGASGYGIGVMGRNIFHGNSSFSSLGALVKSIHIDTRINILLNPKILVEDNTTAEIFVGINTPFQTQTVVNNLGVLLTSNFEYRDVGTRLKVTPLLGNSDIITLIIEEEVNSIDRTAGVIPNAGPTTRKSNSSTRVHIPNEYFLIMSGIIEDQEDLRVSQMPCLGGIPIIGAAVKHMTDESRKRNLLIFLRPRIIDTEEEMDDITKRQQDIYIQRSRHRNRWTEEINAGLDFLNLTCDER